MAAVEIEHEYNEHTKTKEELCSEFKTDLQKGLKSEEIEARQARYGLNELGGENAVPWWKVLLRQVANALTVILVVAVVLAAVKRDWLEMSVILVVIVGNTIIGFKQEYSAEKTMEALKSMASPTAKVMRDTTLVYVSAKEVYPGDILVFEEGDIIPADGRIIECFHLNVDEALLTGESVPVEKISDVIPDPHKAMADRVNMVYSSTTVTRGRGKAIVTRTGMRTEVGKIATQIEKEESESANQRTPLQKAMAVLAYSCFGIALVLILIVFGINQFELDDATLGYAIGLAIAIIPEGLLVVITLTMAAGVKTMAQQKAIVRKLLALENIGSVTTICSDKTGTLTQGKMVLTRVYLPGLGLIQVTGQGYQPLGLIHSLDSNGEAAGDPYRRNNMPEALLKLTECCALCNMSVIKRKGQTSEEESLRLLKENDYEDPPSGTFKQISLDDIPRKVVQTVEDTAVDEWEAIGDPTEAAMQVYAWKAHMSKPELTSPSTASCPLSFELVQEYPFDATIKRMSVIYRETEDGKNENWVFTKGSLEAVLKCTTKKIELDGSITHLGDSKQAFESKMEKNMEALASKGLRVLAIAARLVPNDLSGELENWKREDAERDLVFIGLVGLYDPPRVESKNAVMKCKEAGIMVHMLTGDHPKTATSIAQEIGILPSHFKEGEDVMVATTFDEIDDEKLATMKLPRVIARCTPTTKVKMVNALQARKQVVVMTGDGTNDAPSLKGANIGVSMGLAGSDVAKEASDIILTDDNFASIVKAIAEGRRIFANVQKFVSHLMSTNVSEIIVLIIGLAFTDAQGRSVYPLSAVQILVINMLTSSPPAIGLGLEKATPSQMRVPPRNTSKVGSGVFTVELLVDIFLFGFFLGAFALSIWSIALYATFVPTPELPSPLGSNCNSKTATAANCNYVLRARGATFTFLSICLLYHAINCRSTKHSVFMSKTYGLRTFYKNRVLFWSVISGTIIVILSLYVPGLNDQAFQQYPIGWEWGPVIGFIIAFSGVAELFKYLKRHYFPESFFADIYNKNTEFEEDADAEEKEKVEAAKKSTSDIDEVRVD